MIGRRAALGGLLLLPLPGFAADAGPAAPIAALNAGLLGVMRQGRTVPFPARFAALAPAVDGAFDLAAILRASVGLRWAALAGEQAALLAAFRAFTIASYVANFDSFDGERFEIAPALREAGADRIVQTSIVPQRGDAIRLDYVMRATPGGWRAVDVLVNGAISRVAVQRSDFRALLASGAGALLESLRSKLAELSGGTMKA